MRGGRLLLTPCKINNEAVVCFYKLSIKMDIRTALELEFALQASRKKTSWVFGGKIAPQYETELLCTDIDTERGEFSVHCHLPKTGGSSKKIASFPLGEIPDTLFDEIAPGQWPLDRVKQAKKRFLDLRAETKEEREARIKAQAEVNRRQTFAYLVGNIFIPGAGLWAGEPSERIRDLVEEARETL